MLYKTLHRFIQKNKRNNSYCVQIRHVLNAYYWPGSVMHATGHKETIHHQGVLFRNGDIHLYN